ncbi:MAG: hypothetical protein LBH96_06690 [Candidatus Peribacteria bacterium]|jgi:hypothetical protein|nr:hypothetical protein [Candidatus Peribacteria bacterium]
MYLSNQSFYQQYFSHLSTGQLFPFFEIIDELFVHYGVFKLKHPQTLEIIKKQSPTIFTLLSLLITHKKLNKKDIKELKNLIDKSAEQKQLHFLVESPSKKSNVMVKKSLKKHYKNPKIDAIQSKEIGVKIEGDGYSYKRTLKQDLQKIFQNLV